jgi:hypothetical protein
MSDREFDLRCRLAAERDTVIPDFDQYTGSWVMDMDLGLIESVLFVAQSVWPDKKDLHFSQVEYALEVVGVDYERN